MASASSAQSRAEARSERHAEALANQATVSGRDYRVECLMEDGYVLQQIASILNMPMIDVRLAMSFAGKGPGA